MKKKILVIISFLIIAIILFTPKCIYYDDGGTREFKALLYKVTDVHKLADSATGGGGDGIIDGIIIEILNIEVYRNVENDN